MSEKWTDEEITHLRTEVKRLTAANEAKDRELRAKDRELEKLRNALMEEGGDDQLLGELPQDDDDEDEEETF